jgi:hypothetical protein
LKQPHYQSLRLSKRIKHPTGLPNAWKLIRQAMRTLWSQRWLFLGISLVYGVLSLVLVQGLAATTDVANLKQALASKESIFAYSFGVFSQLVGSSGNAVNGTAATFQFLLILIVSLALIWALREVIAGNKIRIRDSYYQGMHPLIPFILVLLVIVLQLIPMVIAGSLYTIVLANGIAVFAAEKFLWALMFGFISLLSVYMVSSSIFALYIVALPGMTPMRALRSARALVRFRRWTVLRKVLVLPVMLLVLAALVMFPVIVIFAPAAQWVFFMLSTIALAVVHSYLYSLYRELLRD